MAQYFFLSVIFLSNLMTSVALQVPRVYIIVKLNPALHWVNSAYHGLVGSSTWYKNKMQAAYHQSMLTIIKCHKRCVSRLLSLDLGCERAIESERMR